MNHSDDREEWRRERSLLALGRAMRGEDDAPPARSLLTIALEADHEEERLQARARHGLARARREAMTETSSAPPPEPWFEQPEDGRDRIPELAPAAVDGDSTPRTVSATENRPIVTTRRRPRRLVAATTLLGAFLGAAVAFSLPTRYQATVELTVGDDGQGGAIDSQVRVATSGMVLTKVVDKLNLADDPEFNGKDGANEGFAGLLRMILMRDDAAPDDGHRQALAVDRLADTLSVARGEDADSITITATTGNGEKSALIANAVADAFIEVHEQNRSGAISGGSDAANDPSVTAMAAAQLQLDDFANGHRLGDTKDVAAILDLDEDLTAARAHTESLNAKVAALRAAGIGTAAAGLPREFETGALEALRAQYLDLKQQADSAAVKLGPRNPERRGIEAQLAGARDRLSAELRRIVATQQAALKQAVETEQGLAARLARTKLTGEDIATLRNLHEQLAAAEVDRQTTASISSNAADGSVQGAHVVSKAVAPSRPSGPPRTALTLVGTLLGLLAGLGLGVLRGSAEGRTDTESEIDFQPHGETGFESREPVDAVAPQPWPAETAPSSGELHPESHFYQSGSFDSPAIRDSMETAMYPVYSDQPLPAASQPQDQPQHWLQPLAQAPQGHYPPQPMMQPMPLYPAQAYPQIWQPAPPMPAYPYVHPMQAYPGQYYPPQPSFGYAMQDARPAPVIDQEAIDEIRASLHEFREALRELSESRPRRRIF